MQKNNSKPDCYGKLENVFPLGDDGLRYTPESCFACSYRIECMRKATMTGEGRLKIREEIIDRAYQSGMIGFFERWSKKKAVHKDKIRS
mmetsp:Transcript_998/g.755  ORF Transcript_998/g.755 Transcript_998/m.755 type:complete len:89 (+) Transcript_998:449-715(+)